MSRMLLRSLRIPGLILLTPALMAANCKPKPPEVDEIDQSAVQDVKVALTVASLDPSVGKADESFPATLYGAGFLEGAKVKVGETAVSARFVDENTLDLTVPGLAEGTYDVIVNNPDAVSSTLRSGLRIEAGTSIDCSFARLQFGYDQAKLTPESLATLDSFLPCYQATTAVLRVEGHADSRGTTDYNLALGTRRAHAVERHLAAGGIVGSRFDITSYGEEKPLDRSQNEEAG
jgi:outer membrane protein OmpA-like peptidoglycan-associated protein